MERMEGNDAADVALARSGDERAFQALVERHSRAVFRLAFRMTRNEEDAEDVMQETFLKAFERLDQYEDRARFSSWLHRIAANCAYDALRARVRRERQRAEPTSAEEDPMNAVPSDDPTQDRLLFGDQVKRRVAAAMTRLSERERAAFVLRHFEQMTTREIAGVLGLEESAAKQSVFRAVRKLREALEPFAPPPAGAESR